MSNWLKDFVEIFQLEKKQQELLIEGVLLIEKDGKKKRENEKHV